MKRVIAICLTLCLSIALCACAQDTTCANCDSDWEIEYEGKKYCDDCYNDIPGVDLICVNCGEKTGTAFDCCDACYEKSQERAESIAQDLWG